MASKVQALAILLLSLLSLASFSLVTCSLVLPVPPPPNGGGNRPPPMTPPPRNGGGNQPPMMTPSPRNGGGNQPPMVTPPPRNGGGNQPPMVTPPPRNGGGNQPPMMVSPPGGATCPRNQLQLGVCAGLLNLVQVTVDIPPNDPRRRCCTLIEGLADLEATLCLCLAARVNLLNLLNLQLDINLALKVCNRNVPQNAIQCPR